MTVTDLAALLDELGRRLGPAGQHVFELAVRQVYIDGIIRCIGSGVVAVVLLAAWLYIARWTRRRWSAEQALYADGKGRWSSIGQRGPDLFDYAYPFGFGSLFLGLAFLIALATVAGSLARLLNPEYAAIRDILAAVGGVK